MLKMTVLEIIPRNGQAIMRLRHVNAIQNGRDVRDTFEELDCAPIDDVQVWRQWHHVTHPALYGKNMRYIALGPGFGMQAMADELREAVSRWRAREDSRLT